MIILFRDFLQISVLWQKQQSYDMLLLQASNPHLDVVDKISTQILLQLGARENVSIARSASSRAKKEIHIGPLII